MVKDPESSSVDANALDPVQALKDRPVLAERLYAQASAARWKLSPGQFAAALGRSAKKAFHGLPQIAADAVQMARDAGFVLAEETPDFGERFSLGVIKA